MAKKDGVGRYGERVAVRHVEARGWRVLDTNWRGSEGELDIVALDGDVLVVVEVKTRSSLGFGHPAEAELDVLGEEELADAPAGELDEDPADEAGGAPGRGDGP